MIAHTDWYQLFENQGKMLVFEIVNLKATLEELPNEPV